MADKRKRSQNFTSEEKNKLIKLLHVYKSVILNTKTDGPTNRAKNDAWRLLCNRFNATATTTRSKESLMRLWEKMKSEAKLYNTLLMRCTSSTEDGPAPVKEDPILDRVCNLMGPRSSDVADDTDTGDDTYMADDSYTEEPVPIIYECNKKLDSKTSAEDLKMKMLEEEFHFKSQLHRLQLQTAQKELEIKMEIYKQIKANASNRQQLEIAKYEPPDV